MSFILLFHAAREVQELWLWEVPKSVLLRPALPPCRSIWHPSVKHRQDILSKMRGHLLSSLQVPRQYPFIMIYMCKHRVQFFSFLLEFYLSALQFICCFSRITILVVFSLALTVLVGLDISLLLWTELVWYCLVVFEPSILHTST